MYTKPAPEAHSGHASTTPIFHLTPIHHTCYNYLVVGGLREELRPGGRVVALAFSETHVDTTLPDLLYHALMSYA
jgi:hypothetical protein